MACLAPGSDSTARGKWCTKPYNCTKVEDHNQPSAFADKLTTKAPGVKLASYDDDWFGTPVSVISMSDTLKGVRVCSRGGGASVNVSM